MSGSPLHSLHERAGARFLPGDPPTVLTYGDVPAEYQAARETCALFDATQRETLRVTGAERAEFLHRILANGVRGLAPGQGNANLLLTSKGKVSAAFDLFVGDESIDLDAPVPAEELRLAIDRYLFAEDASLEDRGAFCAPIEVCGPTAGDIVGRALGELGEMADHDWRTTEALGGPVRVARLEVAGSPGYRLDAGPEGAPRVWQALVEAGAAPSGLAVRDILRVEAGRAAWGVDIDENVYPQEARLESAFSLEKGCYIGQEVVAKIDTYGGLNKCLMALRIDHDDPVPRGTPLIGADGRELGLITSWSYSFELDSGLCLGYVKRRHQEPGTDFTLGDGAGRATIVELPVRGGTAAATSA